MQSQSREKSDPHELNNPIPYSVSALILGLTLWAVSYIFWTSHAVQEAKSIEQFSQTNTPTKTLVKNTEAPEPVVKDDNTPVAKKTLKPIDGEAIYSAKCSACHQSMGQGLPGVFPPLDGSEWVTTDNSNLPIQIIAKGLMGKITVGGSEYNGMMPAFSSSLPDDELAAVITYIRGAWSNKASAVNTEDVTESLAKYSSQSSSWDGEDQLVDLVGVAK